MILQNASDTLTLSDDFAWVDEFEWSPVAQSRSYTVGGALLIETGQRLAGRPITLRAEPDGPWITRADLFTLLAWVMADPVMNLTRHGVSYAVVFRHADGALEAEPIVHMSPPEIADPHRLTLRLMEV